MKTVIRKYERKDMLKIIWGLLDQANLKESKSQLIEEFTSGETTSMTDLNDDQIKAMIPWLRDVVKDRLHPMRSKIVYYLCMLGYLNGRSPDYDRINKYIQEIGKYNRKKKPLMALNYQELRNICTQVGMRYKREKKTTGPEIKFV